MEVDALGAWPRSILAQILRHGSLFSGLASLAEWPLGGIFILSIADTKVVDANELAGINALGPVLPHRGP